MVQAHVHSKEGRQRLWRTVARLGADPFLPSQLTVATIRSPSQLMVLKPRTLCLALLQKCIIRVISLCANSESEISKH